MKDAIEIIAEQFRRFPGIGVKSALTRLAYFLLELPQERSGFIYYHHSICSYQ